MDEYTEFACGMLCEKLFGENRNGGLTRDMMIKVLEYYKLTNMKWLIIGGNTAPITSAIPFFPGTTDACIVYDPLSSTKRRTIAERYMWPTIGHAAVNIGGGRIMVTGGGSWGANCSIIDMHEKAPTFVRKADMLYSRHHHALILLNSGLVLAFGGGKNLPPEVYNIDEGKWTQAASPLFKFTGLMNACMMRDGCIFVVCQGLCYIYDHEAAVVSLIDKDVYKKMILVFEPVLLADGRVFIHTAFTLHEHRARCFYDPRDGKLIIEDVVPATYSGPGIPTGEGFVVLSDRYADQAITYLLLETGGHVTRKPFDTGTTLFNYTCTGFMPAVPERRIVVK